MLFSVIMQPPSPAGKECLLLNGYNFCLREFAYLRFPETLRLPINKFDIALNAA